MTKQRAKVAHNDDRQDTGRFLAGSPGASRLMSVGQRAWQRFVEPGTSALDGATLDEETVRRGRSLNTLIASASLVSLGVAGIVGIGGYRGYFSSGQQALRMLLFPLGILLLSGVSIGLCKLGWVKLAARVYVWISLVTVVMGAGLINGVRSASWLLVAWPVVLASSLLSPFMGLGLALGAFFVFGAFALAEYSGWYAPLMSTPLASFPYFSLGFGWLMIVVAIGLINAIHGRNLHHTLDNLRATSEALAESQRELARRVVERTSELEVRAEQFRTIAELGQAATAMVDFSGQGPDTFLRRAADLISERLNCYHVGLFLLDRDREWAILRAASSEGGHRMVLQGHRLRVGQQGIVGYVAERGAPRYALNVGEDAAWFSNPDLPDTRSEIALPLVAGGRVIGVLDIQTRRAAAFSDPDLETFGVLADSVAVAIENARLFQEAQETMAQLHRYQASDAIAAWRQALARRAMHVGFNYALGDTYPATEELPLVAPSGSASDGEGAVVTLDLHSLAGVTRRVSEQGTYLLLAPVNVGGERLGALTFERATPWGDEAVRLVTSVVGQLDLALSNARLLEETRLRARQEAARSEIVGRIRAMTSTDAILRNAAEELGRALQVERSRIQLVQFAE